MAAASYVPIGVSVQSSPFFDPFGIFGPLGKNFCLYFYVLAFVYFIFFLIALFALVSEIVMPKRRISLYILTAATISTFLSYLAMRILYNMCIHSVSG
jgi:hypothetical protein